MTESPQLSEKQIKREKKKKMQAFQSFLQKGEEPKSIDLQKSFNLSETSEKVDSLPHTQCAICQSHLGDRIKYCGWCKDPACSDHLRKKRKSKETNKFVRICDSCEDKYLLSKYMKLEVKIQESMSAQQTIILAKKQQVQQQWKGRQTKIKMLCHKKNDLLRQQKQFQGKQSQQNTELETKMEKLRRKEVELEKLELELKKLEESLPPSLEEDYEALEVENGKITRELVKYEKRCNQAIQAKSKRERQVFEEYHQWENSERAKTMKKDEDCIIF